MMVLAARRMGCQKARSVACIIISLELSVAALSRISWHVSERIQRGDTYTSRRCGPAYMEACSLVPGKCRQG